MFKRLKNELPFFLAIITTISTLNYYSKIDLLDKRNEAGVNEKNKIQVLEKKTNRLVAERSNNLRQMAEDDFCNTSKTKMIVSYLKGTSLPLNYSLINEGKAKAYLIEGESKTELTNSTITEKEGQAILNDKKSGEYKIEVCFGNVSSFNNYFTGEKQLKEVKIEKFGSSKSNFEKNFQGCAKLSALTIPDSAIFTGTRITKMDQMFSACSKLSSLDLSKFGVDSALSFTGVTEKCNKLLYLSVPAYSFTLETLNEFIGERTRNLAALDLGDITISKHSDNACSSSGLKNLPKPSTTYLIANEATKEVYAKCFGKNVDDIQNIPRKVEVTQFGTYNFGNQCPVSKNGPLEVAYFFANGVFLCQESCSPGNITFIRKDDKTFCISYVENTNKTIRFNPKKETVSLETKKPKETFSWIVTNTTYELYCDYCPKGYFMYVNRTKYTWCREGEPDDTLASYVRSDGETVYLDKDNCFGTVNKTDDGNFTCNECKNGTKLYKSGDYTNNTCTKDQPNNTLECKPENYDPYFVDKCPENYTDYYTGAGANLTGCVEKCDLLFTNSSGNEVCVDKCPDGYVKYMNKSNVTLCEKMPENKTNDKPFIPYIKKEKPQAKPKITPAPTVPSSSSSSGNPPAPPTPPVPPAPEEEEEENVVDIDKDSCPGLLKLNKSEIVACVDYCSSPAKIFERDNGTETCEVVPPDNSTLCEPIKEDPYYVEGIKCPKDYMELWVNGKIEKCLEKCDANKDENDTAKCNCTGDYTYRDRYNCSWCKNGNPEDDDLIPYIRQDGRKEYIYKENCTLPSRIYKTNNTCLKSQPKGTYIYKDKDGKEYYVDTCPGNSTSEKDPNLCEEEEKNGTEIEVITFLNLNTSDSKICFNVEISPIREDPDENITMKVNLTSGKQAKLSCNYTDERKVCGTVTYMYYNCCSDENYEEKELKDLIYDNTTYPIISQISNKTRYIENYIKNNNLQDFMDRRYEDSFCLYVVFDEEKVKKSYKTDREHFYFDVIFSSPDNETLQKITHQELNDGWMKCDRKNKDNDFSCILSRELSEKSTLRLLEDVHYNIDIPVFKTDPNNSDTVIIFKQDGWERGRMRIHFDQDPEPGHYETNRRGSGLNAGAIVAIVLSVLFVFGLVIFLVLMHKRDKDDKKQETNQGIGAMANTNSNIKIGS